jgi:DNA topoisomerase-1
MAYRNKTAAYWLSRHFGGSYKWKTLEHNGVFFPPEYIYKKIPIIYNGENLILSKEAEEVAFMYAKYLDCDHIKSGTFNKNFWNDWKKLLGSDHTIQKLDLVDFSLMKQYLIECKDKSKDNKGIKQDDTKYKTAIVDGKEQPVGNFRIEPPGIFIGRGKNPKLGKLKNRIYPEDITLNIGKEATVPGLQEHLLNHKWGKIIHDKHVEWLASWKDNITGKYKYVWLGAHSDMKSDSDIKKFDLARKLKRKIKHINEINDNNMASTDKKIRQIATAMFFINKLALRVGNEKGADEADTVGVTGLRVEHIILEPSTNILILDFLGKDSVRYQNKVKIDPIIYKNINEFMQDKDKSDDLFDLVTSSDINKYLQEFMKGLTAKVFRTYNASNLFQKEIKKLDFKYAGTTNSCAIIEEFNKANAKVAIVMNHQKNIAKGYKTSLDKISVLIRKLQGKLRKTKNKGRAEKLRNQIKEKKLKKENKKYLKNISLETSKANYIDPRITVAFFKRHNLPIEKVFSSTLQKKFNWAFSIEPSYKF